MEPPFDKTEGVQATIVGYTGGQLANPSYKQVSAGETHHLESIQVIYDPAVVSYSELLNVFWRQINPTTPDRQFVDIGAHYRSAIFYHDETQKEAALASKETLEKSGRFDQPIVTEIIEAGKFWPAEDYHQDYYKKNPLRYKYYRFNSGRDQFLDKVWADER